MPYWYYELRPGSDYATTELAKDVAQFITNADGAGPYTSSGQAGGFRFLDQYSPELGGVGSEVIDPPSTAPDFSNEIAQFIGVLKGLYDQAVTSTEQFGKQLVAQAKALGGQIAAEAKQLANQLVAQAKAAGGEVLAAAKQKAKEIEKAAGAEVKRTWRPRRRTRANSLYKQGKLFGKGASNEVAAAEKQLAAVQQQSQKTINQDQKAAFQAVALVAKKVGEAKAKAEAAAAAAQAKLEAARAKAQADAQAAAAKLAAAAAQAKAAAAAAAQNLANQAKQAGGALASGFQSAKKKFGL